MATSPSAERRHQHWGTVVRAADPRILIDTATSRWGTWATLVLAFPLAAPWTHLRPIHTADRARSEEVHRQVCRWVLDLHSGVSCDPDVCTGHPVMRGTRVGVDQILELMTEEGQLDWGAVRENYPSVHREAAEVLVRLPGHVRRTLIDLCQLGVEAVASKQRAARTFGTGPTRRRRPE